MDTTHIEYTAEDLIAHKLQHAGFLVAKPKFDRDGADLLALMHVKDGAKFCRIQCKGRSLMQSIFSNVKVQRNYVKGAFVLFLYINDGTAEKTNLFCFFPEDIKKQWKLKKLKKSENDYYFLSLSKSAFNAPDKKGNITAYLFNNDKIETIKQIIEKADSRKELKIMYDLLKKQSNLVAVQKKKYELEALIKDIAYIEEKKNMLDEKINILEDNYNYLAKQYKTKRPNESNKKKKGSQP